MEREVSTQTRVRVTPEEYLALERQAETRSEYFAIVSTPIHSTSWSR